MSAALPGRPSAFRPLCCPSCAHAARTNPLSPPSSLWASALDQKPHRAACLHEAGHPGRHPGSPGASGRFRLSPICANFRRQHPSLPVSKQPNSRTQRAPRFRRERRRDKRVCAISTPHHPCFLFRHCGESRNPCSACSRSDVFFTDAPSGLRLSPQ